MIYRSGSTKTLGFMRDNFLISWSNIKQGKLHTLITSNFSHKDFTRIYLFFKTSSYNPILDFLINNFILYSFGPAVVSIVGLPAFVPLYIAAGVSSSVFHLAYDRWAKPKLFPHLERQNVSSLGASGAISGLSIIFALTHPFHTVQLFMIIPLPAIGCVGGFFLYDLYKAFEGRYVNGIFISMLCSLMLFSRRNKSYWTCWWCSVWDSLLDDEDKTWWSRIAQW